MGKLDQENSDHTDNILDEETSKNKKAKKIIHVLWWKWGNIEIELIPTTEDELPEVTDRCLSFYLRVVMNGFHEFIIGVEIKNKMRSWNIFTGC